MPLDDTGRLRHMLDAALEAQTFMKDITQESLREDRKTAQAVVRSIEVIGEAAVNVSKEFKEMHPDIPWKKIAGMRNWLIHAYFDVDYNHIWSTVQKDLPVLVPQLKKLLNEG
ncbi:MAG: hypothetical protein MAG551_01997 [Candidatus Scalindua arabica]|uniref:DUF86 domain-containing protein n=1 Tax=Candidatus Scalindua arabica TaxID=1127984 RepID=A0A941W465_9BACT|nr:hypothetical protein [Candidatus Scalindua arabica]